MKNDLTAKVDIEELFEGTGVLHVDGQDLAVAAFTLRRDASDLSTVWTLVAHLAGERQVFDPFDGPMESIVLDGTINDHSRIACPNVYFRNWSANQVTVRLMRSTSILILNWSTMRMLD
jgi:hypothetical protein